MTQSVNVIVVIKLGLIINTSAECSAGVESHRSSAPRLQLADLEL